MTRIHIESGGSNISKKLEKGIFCISLDTELAWGKVYQPRALEDNYRYYEQTRAVIDSLLELFVRFEVPATWAVVGHLFLESCRPQGGVKHPEIPRSSYPWYEGDWFDADPCSDLESEPCWYGKDIVEKIQGCPVPQEIGCHSFSHILFGDRDTKRETVRAELEECRKLAEKQGLELKSFVFPRNQEGYLDEIKQAGIEVIRGKDPLWYKDYPVWLQKVCHIVDQVLAVPPPVVVPVEREGLLDIPGSMIYLSRQGFRKYLAPWARIRKAKKGLARAADENRIFHLWFHPFNLATGPEKLLPGMEKILQEAECLRQQGRLEIMTMAQIAAAHKK